MIDYSESDFYIQGKNRLCKVQLYLKDNLLVSALDEMFDVIICDGPYGNWPEYGWEDVDWDDFDLDDKEGREEFKDYYRNLFSHSLANLKEHGSLFVHNYPEGASLIKSVLDDVAVVNFRRWITWTYDNHFDFDRRSNFHRSQETILYYVKGQSTKFQHTQRMQGLGGCIRDVFSFPILKIEDNKFKDGAKPVGVVDYCVKPVAVPGGKLLSLFGGSGTDIVVALANDMDVVAFESNSKHFDMIIDRIYNEYVIPREIPSRYDRMFSPESGVEL